MSDTEPRGLQRLPLRVTLVLSLIVLVAVGLIATGVVVTTAIRSYLVGQVDRDLVALSTQMPHRGMFGSNSDTPFQTRRDEYVAIAGTDGSIAPGLQAVNRSGVRLPALDPRRVVAGADDRTPFTVASRPRGTQWRVLAQPALLNGETVVLIRAVSLADVQATTRRLVAVELVVGLVTLGLLGLAATALVRTSLRPLEQVEETAAAIAAGDLARRVPPGHPGTEVGRLSAALNGMLAQIESAFRARQASAASARASEERMRRFVADASHELRTPLTSIRGYAELFRQGAAEDPAQLETLLRRIEEESTRMGGLVEDLLLLARLDQQRPLQLRPVSLLDLVTDAATDARAVAPDRDIRVQVDGDDPVVVQGDQARLRQVIANLVNNALTHTPPASPVELRLSTVPAADGRPSCARLAVRDDGPGLQPHERERVFERFYRADKARTRAAGGSGLGLSIVAALVAAHGGRVGVESEPGRGATFLVELPLLTGDAEAAAEGDAVATPPSR